MQVAVISTYDVASHFNPGGGVHIDYFKTLEEVTPGKDFIFYLLDEETLPAALTSLQKFNCPVIVNAVCTTLENLPSNFCRINAWPGFINCPIKEVVAAGESMALFTMLFDKLKWKYSYVADVPGMISARVISMVINEAWFALDDGVSTKDNIDLAMKLGTNYPYGPFEWGDLIGINKIKGVLQELSNNNKRYAIAPLLLKN